MWARTALSVALRGPGKALLLVSAAGWLATAWALGAFPAPLSPAPHQHGAAPLDTVFVWTAMIVAMAPPLLLREVGVVWRSTLRRRRARAMVLFTAGYAAVWLLAGLVIMPAGGWASANAARSAMVLAVAALWHCAPARQRVLNACHRVPTLPLFATAADRGALRYGAASGLFCTAACGMLMLLVLLVGGHHLLAMLAAATIATVERHLPPRPARWRIPFVTTQEPAWPGGKLDIDSAAIGR